MRRIALALAVLAVVVLQADARPRHQPPNRSLGACRHAAQAAALGLNDGCAGAPAGSPQYPNLLSGYAAGHPPFDVAGVDFHVGVPSWMVPVLADPISIPTTAATSGPLAGVSRSGNSIRCDGGYSGSILNGYDFSLHGGFGANVVSCPNFTVTNSNFAVGANCAGGVSAAGTSVNLTVTYNTFDGGGGNPLAAACMSTNLETVTFNSTGTATFLYNWIKNVSQHFVTFEGTTAVPNMQFNLIERCGFYQGNHCNGFQIVGGTNTGANFNFNLSRSTLVFY